MNKIKELYEYRYMLATLIKQDLLGKYRKSILGLLWTLINPLIQLIVYVVLFQYIFDITIENYPIYLFIGIMGWNLFSVSLTAGTGSIVRNSGMVKKIYFPKEVLPIAILIGNVINYILTLPITILGLYISGIGLTWHILLLPIILIVQFIFTYSLTLIFAGLNVFARDIEQLLNNLLFVWMYITPVVFSIDMVPNALKIIFYLNPMLYIINAYRDLLYYNKCFDIKAILIVLVVSLILVIIAQFIFNKLSKRFVEEL